MDGTYPQELFSTPGMTSVFAFVMALEVLSLAYFGITVAEYGVLRRKHRAFFKAIKGGTKAHEERASGVIFWIYVATTIAVTGVTTVTFVFQPHLI